MLEQNILEAAGYQVDLASSAEAGLVRATHPETVVRVRTGERGPDAL